MFDELINRYSQYSDSELMKVYLNKDGYTEDARKALEIVVDRKGGIQSLNERYDRIVEKENEKLRINDDVIKFYKNGFTKNDINSHLKSEILSTSELQEILDETIHSLESTKKDLEINSGTVIGSLLGGTIGGIVGGVLWGLQMIYSGHIFYIFAVGLAIISYGFIKLFTKQSRSNTVVFIAILLSVMFAMFLGSYIYDLLGYQGPDKYLK